MTNRSSRPVKKVFLEISQNSQEKNTKGLQLYLKDTLTQEFYCEFSEV